MTGENAVLQVFENESVGADRDIGGIRERARWRADYIKALMQDGYLMIHTRAEMVRLIPGTIVRMPIAFLARNEEQPRFIFKKNRIKELGESIKVKKDVNKPIGVIIRHDGRGEYFGLIVGGERRWRAAKKNRPGVCQL